MLPLVDHSWVGLVDIGASDRVLLVDAAGGRAEPGLRRRTESVSVVGARDLPAVREALACGGWDLVCLDGADVSSVAPERWSTVLAPQGRVVVVGDHLASPLRVLDALTRRTGGPGARLRHAGTLRRLRRSGLHVHQVFGLMRSSDRPVVAFDVLAPSSLPAVYGATLAHVHGWRGRALRLARRLPAAQIMVLCPGWLAVTGRSPDPAPDRIVGKVSNQDSDEDKLLRGEPVSSVERRYRVGAADSEHEALTELEAVGFALAPRVLGSRSEVSSHCTWMSGEPLAVDRLSEDELVSWVGRAARVLLDLQAATAAPDGTVLLHGDYWLGNLLTEGDRVTAVVDWTAARRGDPEVDREFLVDSLERWITGEALRARLRAEVSRCLAGPRPG